MEVLVYAAEKDNRKRIKVRLPSPYDKAPFVIIGGRGGGSIKNNMLQANL